MNSLIYGLFPWTHTNTNIKYYWEIINLMKDAHWSAQNLIIITSKREYCQLAHSTLQGYVLRDAPGPSAANANVLWVMVAVNSPSAIGH